MSFLSCYCLLVQVILQADKTTNNFSDRALLKNLGHWLGLQMLAKNKPILQVVRIEQRSMISSFLYFYFLPVQDLGVKDLILEAHYRGQQVIIISGQITILLTE